MARHRESEKNPSTLSPAAAAGDWLAKSCYLCRLKWQQCNAGFNGGRLVAASSGCNQYCTCMRNTYFKGNFAFQLWHMEGGPFNVHGDIGFELGLVSEPVLGFTSLSFLFLFFNASAPREVSRVGLPGEAGRKEEKEKRVFCVTINSAYEESCSSGKACIKMYLTFRGTHWGNTIIFRPRVYRRKFIPSRVSGKKMPCL